MLRAIDFHFPKVYAKFVAQYIILERRYNDVKQFRFEIASLKA